MGKGGAADAEGVVEKKVSQLLRSCYRGPGFCSGDIRYWMDESLAQNKICLFSLLWGDGSFFFLFGEETTFRDQFPHTAVRGFFCGCFILDI